MFRLFSFLVFICFFSWILPLGAFIKPSQEGTACGGKRAFHMCTMEIRKIRPAETSPKISFTNTSGYGHQGKSSAGGSEDDFVVASRDGRLKDNNFRHFGFSPSLAYSYFPDSIEPPPKTFPIL